jgi:hypothetical protein
MRYTNGAYGLVVIQVAEPSDGPPREIWILGRIAGLHPDAQEPAPGCEPRSGSVGAARRGSAGLR